MDYREMKELIQHPDTMRWVIWSWETQCDNSKWENYFTTMFKTFASSPVEIVLTKNSITIFKGIKINIRSAPEPVRICWKQMYNNKSEYFNKIETNTIFKDITCKDCVLDKTFNRIIDRKAWISWSCWWILCCNTTKIFIIKDMLTVSLRNIKQVKLKERLHIEHLPLPPCFHDICKCEKKHDDKSVFLCIYNNIQQPIYNECINTFQYLHGVAYG
jgi:hypothetical protein